MTKYVWLFLSLKRTLLDEGHPRLMAANSAKPEKKIAQQVGYWDSWWPGAESNHRHKDFQISSDRPLSHGFQELESPVSTYLKIVRTSAGRFCEWNQNLARGNFSVCTDYVAIPCSQSP